MRILLANPRGFCAGVDRAVLMVKRLLKVFGPPVFVRHEIVHNRHVVESLRRDGAVFVNHLSEVPDGAPIILSAHGVPPSVYHDAKMRRLQVFDATCPLVSKVHLEIAARSRVGYAVIVIGDINHAEIVGTVGYYDTSSGGGLYLVNSEADAEVLEVPNAARLAYVTQTTLSVTATARIVSVLTRRFPSIVGPPESDVCYATESRQKAVEQLTLLCSFILVVGSPDSSNSRHLIEVAEQAGATARLIQSCKDIEARWFQNRPAIGITSAASTPDCAVQEVLERIHAFCPGSTVETFGEPENIVFRLPREMMSLSRAPQ